MAVSPLQPLLTKSPMDTRSSHTFTCPYPFSASPITTHHGHQTSSPSTSPTATSPPLHGGYDILEFKKIRLPSTAEAGGYPMTSSTDSEAIGSTSDCPTPHNGRRSPSLLTCLFISNNRSNSSSRQTSSSGSGSSQPTPITPASSFSAQSGYPYNYPSASAHGQQQGTCKPILRRDTSVSTSTSLSEDSHSHSHATTPWKPLSPTQPSELPQNTTTKTLHSRRSCLKFSVAQANMSINVSGHHSLQPPANRGRRTCRSPAPVPVWDEIPCALPVEIEDPLSDDEGYVEDEEDGYDSDEEEGFGTFNSLKENSKWETRYGGSSRYRTSPSPMTRGGIKRHPADVFDDEEDEEQSDLELEPEHLEDEDESVEKETHRGRTVSIAGKCGDKCSRHISPPPPEFNFARGIFGGDNESGEKELASKIGMELNLNLLGLGLDPAPPAAHSPSAAEFCRRKGSGNGLPRIGRDRNQGSLPLTSFTIGRASVSNGSPIGVNRIDGNGWRSDDSGWLNNQSKSSLTLRKASLPEETMVGKGGILRCTPIPPVAPITTSSNQQTTQPLYQRRGSSPVDLKPCQPCNVRLDDQHAIVTSASYVTSESESAKRGLERALKGV